MPKIVRTGHHGKSISGYNQWSVTGDYGTAISGADGMSAPEMAVWVDKPKPVWVVTSR